MFQIQFSEWIIRYPLRKIVYQTALSPNFKNLFKQTQNMKKLKNNNYTYFVYFFFI